MVGDGVTLIDSGAAAAGEAKRMMEMHGLLSGSNDMGNSKYYVSDTVHGFEELGSLFLSKKLRATLQKSI